jgi:c-di-GMP-binding flagellar brake protein YcgR
MDVVLQDAGGWEIPVESVDVSPTGMFVRSDFLFKPGAKHVLIFRAPDGQFLFRLRARVVRVASDETPPGMAYEFLGVDAETERRLRALVDDASDDERTRAAP